MISSARTITLRPAAVLALLVLALAPESLAKRRPASHRPPFTVAALDSIAAAARQSGVPGLTIGVRKGGSMIVRSYGTPPPEDVYQIGSVTKQFTAAAIMRLVERGTLRVEDKARVWLPELGAPYDAITIEHLLTHTSGLVNYTQLINNPYVARTQQEIVAMVGSQPLQFAPGSRFAYSNSGYFFLGIIIERASSKSYEQFLRDEFFTPLALDRTSYCNPGPDGHVINQSGTLFQVEPADMSVPYAAGALCANAGDLLRWNEALAGGRIVSPESYARMTTSVDPTLTPPPGYGYALIIDTFEGRRRIWHNGAIVGFTSHLEHYPDEDLSVVVLVNALDLRADRAGQIAAEVARAMKP